MGADQEQLHRLLDGVKAHDACDSWNRWRKANPHVRIHLPGVTLSNVPLFGIILSHANLSGANFEFSTLYGGKLNDVLLDGANLGAAALRNADLRNADLHNADLGAADLRSADLRSANLSGANLMRADLRSAKLCGADLRGTNLKKASLYRADFQGACIGEIAGARTRWERVRLSHVKGLDSICHLGPSEVDRATIQKSSGQIPEAFLRDCGISEELIGYAKTLREQASASSTTP